jgi:hypothetical protein
MVGFVGDENSANLVIADRVPVLGQLGNIAMIGLECFI